MVYHYTGTMDSHKQQIPARQLKPGMFVLYQGGWHLVYAYDQEESTLTIINARKGGVHETKVMRPDFLVTVRAE